MSSTVKEVDYNGLRISLVNTDGFISHITGCDKEDTVLASTLYRPKYVHARLSPDQSMIAVTVEHEVYNYSIGDRMLTTLIYNVDGQEIKRYSHYHSSDWLPDGRLLLLGGPTPENYGIHILDKGFNHISQLDNGGKFKTFIGSADVSPSGKQVVFEYNRQIWIMNMDGTGLGPLIKGNSSYLNPTWSPDGNYIAFLDSYARNSYDTLVHIYDIKSKKHLSVDTNKVFTNDGRKSPRGPLSWTK